jgi:mono/diheme cytochrome c family protein
MEKEFRKINFCMFLLLLFFSLAFNFGCSKSSNEEINFTGKSPDEIKLIERGKTIYSAICTACHNANPKMDGSLGPAIAGSSLELIESRVLRAEYPKGYKPKRETHAMIALPQFKNEVPALHAYLNALK